MPVFGEISYSEIGLQGRDLFFAEFSDVLFYFEDENHEAVYEKLISIVAPEYLTNSVLCLGGKSNLIKLAKAPNDLEKPRVFVADRDFDHILGKVESVEGLVYLDRFSIENYLLSFPALLEVAVDRFALRITEAHQKCEKFDGFFEAVVDRYEKLTRLFLVARKNRLSIQTTKMPISDFIGEELDDFLPDEFIDEYKKKLLEVAEINCSWLIQEDVFSTHLEKAFEPRTPSAAVSVEPLVNILCGKHLFGIMRQFLEIMVGIDFDQIGVTSIYMDVMGRITNFKDSLNSVKYSIDATVVRQRKAIAI